MWKRLDRYIVSEVVGPLGLGFLVYTFILLLRFLFQSAEMIIRRGLPVSIVGELLLLSVPNIVVLTLPMSLLFGILIAVGRLSSDSELIAMRASGVSLLSLYRPILAISALFTLLNTLLMVYVLPWGNHALQELRIEILTESVSRQVEPRVFYDEWQNKVIYVFEVPPGEKRWKGVFLSESQPDSSDNLITVADWGEINVDPSGEQVVLSLFNAYRHKVNLNAPGRYEITKNNRLDLVVEDRFTSDQKAKMTLSKSLRELSFAELRKVTRDPGASDEDRNLARVELQKKFAIPAACIVFGLFALPLGINNRRGGKASGFALSIGVIIVYYVLLNNGEEAAHFGKTSAWLAMWTPNLLFAVAGTFLLFRRNRDKSLLVSRVDRWVRQNAWQRLMRAKSWGSRKSTQIRGGLRAVAAPSARKAASPPDVVLRLPRPRILFPNLIDRYVLRLFVRVFLLVLVSGIVLFILFDLTEHIDEFIKNKIANSVILTYYKYQSLQIFYNISPIVVLVTTLITISLLARSNEITAFKALGISLYRIALPAVAAALLVSMACGFLQSGVLPAANEKIAKLKDRIKGQETVRHYRRADKQWLFGHGRYIYNYSHYDPQTQTLDRLQVFDFSPDHRLLARIYADTARYNGEAWEVPSGWARWFDGVLPKVYKSFKSSVIRYPETPEYFDSEIRPPEQQSYTELKEYVGELKESGQPSPPLEVELHNKIAFPAVSLVMALVGLPFAFRLGKQGALYGIGVSVGLGIVFMVVLAFFTSLGQAGALPPAVAVWSPSAIFSLLAVYLFLGVRT